MRTLLATAGLMTLMCSQVGCSGDTSVLPPLTGALAVSAGASHTCALLIDSSVTCWGEDVSGQLGDQQTTFSEPTPVAVKGLNGIKSIAVGADHTCAIIADDSVSCWGDNHWGQIGNGAGVAGLPGAAAGMLSVLTPMAVTGLTAKAKAIVTGRNIAEVGGHTCALLDGGDVQCWGENELGLAPNPQSIAFAPTAIPGLMGVTKLAMGDSFGCAILMDETVACWGLGPIGQPSKPDLSFSAVPNAVNGLTGVVDIAAGSFHVCALLGDGTVQCWGASDGIGTAQDSSTPLAIQGLASVKAITAAGFQNYALLGDGTIKGWGLTLGGPQAPTAVKGVADVLAISAGEGYACAVIADGTVKCWGDNTEGQLGNGTNELSARGPLSGPTTVASISPPTP